MVYLSSIRKVCIKHMLRLLLKIVENMFFPPKEYLCPHVFLTEILEEKHLKLSDYLNRILPHLNVSQYHLNSMPPHPPKKKKHERVYKYLKIKILLRDTNILKILNIKYHKYFGPLSSQGVGGFSTIKPSTIQSLKYVCIYVYFCVYTYSVYV